MIITEVIEKPSAYGRTAYLILEENKVVFDDSDDEYGPINFDLDILEAAIIRHKLKLQKNEE